jgi:hypothetical protein
MKQSIHAQKDGLISKIVKSRIYGEGTLKEGGNEGRHN